MKFMVIFIMVSILLMSNHCFSIQNHQSNPSVTPQLIRRNLASIKPLSSTPIQTTTSLPSLSTTSTIAPTVGYSTPTTTSLPTTQTTQSLPATTTLLPTTLSSTSTPTSTSQSSSNPLPSLPQSIQTTTTFPATIGEALFPQVSKIVLPPIVPLAPSMIKTSQLLSPASFLTKFTSQNTTLPQLPSGNTTTTKSTVTSTTQLPASATNQSPTTQPFFAQITHEVDNVTNESTVHINLQGLFDNYDESSYQFSDDPDGQALAGTDTWN